MTEVISKKSRVAKVLKKVSWRTSVPKNRRREVELACVRDAVNEASSREEKGSVVSLRLKVSLSKSKRDLLNGPNQSPEPTPGLRPGVAHL